MLNNKKKVAFWGIGNICRMCVQAHPTIMPDFFIDSCQSGPFLGKKVIHPNEISDWSNIFVVITNLAFDKISAQLENYGAIYQRDYLSFIDYYDINKTNTRESLIDLEYQMVNGQLFEGGTLLFAPFVQARNANIIIKFFSSYAKANEEKCIGLSNILPYDEKQVTDLLGFPVKNLPEICRWDGIVRNSMDLQCEDFVDEGFLDEEVEQIENFKVSKTPNAHSIDGQLCYYFENVFKILKPRKVVIWGGWSRFSLILEFMAKKYDVLYVFAEWGWIPGTLQFDPVGIAGRSEYAKNKNLQNLLCKIDSFEVDGVCDYILLKKSQQIATVDPKEEDRIRRLISNGKKTVLFIGMGDLGMGIISESSFWKENVSAFVKSTVEAVERLAEICEKKGYNLIFKPHPEQTTIAEESVKKNNVLQVCNTSVEALIEYADAVVSIASAVDYMVLMLGKPLVQLGETGMNYADCSYKVSRMETIENQLEKAIRNGLTDLQKNNYKKYLAFLLQHYLWDDMTHDECKYGLAITDAIV